MNKKIGLVVAAMILVAGFLLSSLLSNQKDPVGRRPSKPALSNYKFHTVENKPETFTIELSGNLRSYNEIALFTEVTGVAEPGKVEFREGAKFRKGDLLLRITDTEYKNNVYAQKSAFMNNLTTLLPDLKMDFPGSADGWQAYLAAFDIQEPLKPLPTVKNEKEKYFITSRNIYNQYYSIKSLETRLEKYSIHAPFDGIITESMIKPGTLVRAGQNIGTYKNTLQFELTAFAGVKEIQFLKTGMPVKLLNNDINEEFHGTISRINQSIDQRTQKIKVYIFVENETLIDGLYFNAVAKVNTGEPVSKIPAEAIFESSSVWLNEEGKFKSRQLTIINRDDEYVYVRGLKDGERILLNPDKKVSEGREINFSNQQKRG